MAQDPKIEAAIQQVLDVLMEAKAAEWGLSDKGILLAAVKLILMPKPREDEQK